MANSKSVVIVGAGMAGLTAARKLVDKGFQITVLEANKERYGGRIYSYDIPENNGKRIDLGAMWIHAGTNKKQTVGALCKEFGIKTSDFRVSWLPTTTPIFDEQGRPLSKEEHEAADIAMEKFEQLLDDATDNLVENNLPDKSVQTLLTELSQTDPDFINQDAIKNIMVPMFEAYMSGTVDELSLKFMEGLPESDETLEIEGDDLMIPSGYKTLVDKIVYEKPQLSILLDRQVKEIKVNQQNSLVEIACSDKANNSYQYTADHVVVAVPLGILKSKSIHFEPPLSANHLKAIDRIGFGNRMKVLLVFDQIFWPEDRPVMFSKAKQFTFHFINLKRINGVNGLLLAFDAVGSNWGKTLTTDAVVKIVLERLQGIFGEEKVTNARLLHSKVVNWGNEPFFLGAYSFGKIGMEEDDGYAIRKPLLPHIFFAGEHTEFPSGEPGTVLAAHLSGKRVATEIIALYGEGKNDKK